MTYGRINLWIRTMVNSMVRRICSAWQIRWGFWRTRWGFWRTRWGFWRTRWGFWRTRWIVSLLVLGGCLGVEPNELRPNILFIMVDDLGPEWIGAYGGEMVETPNVDRLAAEGVLFTKAYSMPQCTPTRVTLLTGQYPYRHGWTNHWDVPRWGAGAHFDADLNYSFARLFRDAGYATAAAGKWQINDFRVQPDAMVQHGFDDYAMWTGFETPDPALGDAPNPSAERYQDAYIHTKEGSRTYEGQFGPDVYTDFLIDFMRAHRDEPMLLYFPMALTHPPLVATPHDPDADGMIGKHSAMVRYMDFLVGRLVDTLDELGLRERTYIVYTTDNGTSKGIDGRMNGREVAGGKGTLGENGIHAPFIVSGPRIPSGVTTDALMDFSDLFPTFSELAGLAVPDSLVMDGYSFAPVLRDPSDSGRRDWVLSMGFGPAKLTQAGVVPVKPFTDRAVRDARFKLWVEDGISTALYDLATDPGESANLLQSAEPAHREARARLEEIVASFPREDARPRYRPLLPQPWDRQVGE